MGITRNVVPTVRVLDVVTERGIPFRVVYGKRQFMDGSFSLNPVVAFYDRRFTGDSIPHFTEHGQFVSDFSRGTLLGTEFSYGLDLDGDTANWYIDGSAMYVIRTWLNHAEWQEER
jgi:hypothetical protein